MTLLDIRYYMTLKFIEVCVESVGLRNVDHYFRTMPPYREVISFLGPHVTEGTNPVVVSIMKGGPAQSH